MKGQTVQVYKEISAIGPDAFLPGNFLDIEMVLIETFQRVAYNLGVIYKELIEMGYLFKKECKFNFERPLHAPLPDTDSLLEKLDGAVKPFGFVPLSLQYFYKIVGGVNFVWDYETNPDLMWNMADPMQIASLDAVVDETTRGDWKEYIQEYLDDEDYGTAFLVLAADDLHKDNISGGPPYSLEITKLPSIDGDFLNEPNGTTLISYLRMCIDYCGFPGIKSPAEKNDYEVFFGRVKPKLKPI